MEKLNDIIIKEYNSHSLLTSCLYIEKYDIMACGDNRGRLLIFDQRVQKPFVQLIISESESEISNIQYSNDNDELFFSSEDTIYSCDNITNSYTKKIYQFLDKVINHLLFFRRYFLVLQLMNKIKMFLLLAQDKLLYY